MLCDGEAVLDLIEIVAGLALCLYLPTETRKVLRGEMPKHYKGVAGYRRMLTWAIGLGAVMGVARLIWSLSVGGAAAQPLKLMIGVMYLAVAAVALMSRRSLDRAPGPGPTGSK